MLHVVSVSIDIWFIKTSSSGDLESESIKEWQPVHGSSSLGSLILAINLDFASSKVFKIAVELISFVFKSTTSPHKVWFLKNLWQHVLISFGAK